MSANPNAQILVNNSIQVDEAHTKPDELRLKNDAIQVTRELGQLTLAPVSSLYCTHIRTQVTMLIALCKTQFAAILYIKRN
jgi:hypothetical protein